MAITSAAVVGEKLKKTREGKSLTIDQVQKQTRIHSAVINAIEEGRCDEMLTSTYVKSYLKKYSEHLGLDPVQVIKDYASSDTKPSSQQQPQAVNINTKDTRKPPDLSGIIKIAGIAIVVLAAAVTFSFISQKIGEFIKNHKVSTKTAIQKKKPVVAPAAASKKSAKKKIIEKKRVKTDQAVGTESIKSAVKKEEFKTQERKPEINRLQEAKPVHKGEYSEPRVLQVKDAAEQPALPVTSLPAQKPKPNAFTLVMKIKDTVLVEVKKDGVILFRNVMDPGIDKTFSADEEISIFTAKGEALELILDGKPLGSPGKGIIKQIDITKKGIKVKK